jgi:hypothetical protein
MGVPHLFYLISFSLFLFFYFFYSQKNKIIFRILMSRKNVGCRSKRGDATSQRSTTSNPGLGLWSRTSSIPPPREKEGKKEGFQVFQKLSASTNHNPHHLRRGILHRSRGANGRTLAPAPGRYQQYNRSKFPKPTTVRTKIKMHPKWNIAELLEEARWRLS